MQSSAIRRSTRTGFLVSSKTKIIPFNCIEKQSNIIEIFIDIYWFISCNYVLLKE